jgi:hypothetical protein
MHGRNIARIEPPGFVGQIGCFRIAPQLPQERPGLEAIVHQDGNPLGGAVAAAIVTGIVICCISGIVLSFLRGCFEILFIHLWGREEDVHQFVVVGNAGGV